jgi:hypothetical protein
LAGSCNDAGLAGPSQERGDRAPRDREFYARRINLYTATGLKLSGGDEMHGVFAPDAKVKAIAAAYALDAVDFAQQAMSVELDWTEPSIMSVETVLDRMHKSIPKDKPSRNDMEVVAKMFGSYLGEVFIRHHGGDWGMVTLDGETSPGIRAARNGSMFWPWARAIKRLENGSEDNVWDYYQQLTSG